MLTDGRTNEKNIILYKDFRISILKEGIIRIEKDPKLLFNDEPTQKILYRNFKQNKFLSKIDGDFLVVELKRFLLYFNGILVVMV